MSRVLAALAAVVIFAALLIADITAAGLAVTAFTSWEQGTIGVTAVDGGTVPGARGDP